MADLTDWADRHPEIFDRWEIYTKSGHDTALRPCLTRIDHTKPFGLDNLRLTVYAAMPRPDDMPVAAYNKDGTVHSAYVSVKVAAEAVNGRTWNIRSVAEPYYVKDANGKLTTPKTYRGLSWRWL